jgi:fluoride exporter
LDKILLSGLGGFIGSALRYCISLMAYRVFGQTFPYGTLFVNVLGCLLIGFVMAIFEDRFVFSANSRIFITIGILGGFTTFSSFSYETIVLLREGSYLLGTANVLLNVFLCLGVTVIGLIIGKLV